MNDGTVILTFNEGNPEDQELVFSVPGTCVVGRGDDCDVRLPTDYAHSDVSRHHCQFEVDPPHIRVRDLGSRNGTFVNGARIGQRHRLRRAGSEHVIAGTACDLHSGDEVRVGITFFRVAVVGAYDSTRLPENHMYFV